MRKRILSRKKAILCNVLSKIVTIDDKKMYMGTHTYTERSPERPFHSVSEIRR